MIAEGEKAALAARILAPDYVGITSSGGCKAATQADWSPLAVRRVLIWRDADPEGELYAHEVTRILHSVGVTDIRWLSLAIFGNDLKKGYDAHDALTDGWTSERFAAALQREGALELPIDPGDDPKEGLPIIRLIPGNLYLAIKKAERLIQEAGTALYDRGGQLVRPVIQATDVTTDDGVKIPAGSLVITAVTPGWLQLTYSRHIAWYKQDSKGDLRRDDPPPKVAETYLHYAGDWNVPTLTGIVEAPTIRRDGTILTACGYDAKSGLYLDYAGLPVIVKDRPTRGDALEALLILRGVIKEFPFVRDVDRSVALSCLLTAVARRALRTAPFHVFDSPERGTGKSLLANVCAIIATGRPATTATLTTSPDENQKRLESYLIRGVPFLNIDNIDRPVDGAFLCSLATEETVDPRPLGHSTFIKIKTSTVTVTMTGNNVVIAGDLNRRTLICRIDAQMERPDSRIFEIADLKRHVADHRHELLGAALTILRAYIVAGKSAHGKEPYGSFYDWDTGVRGALIWLGQADPLESRARILEVDPTSGNLGVILTAWHALIGEEAITAKNLKAKATADEGGFDRDGKVGNDTTKQHREILHDALLEVAEDKDGHINTTKLGNYLRASTDKVTRGLRLEHAGTYSDRQRYRVRLLERGKHDFPDRPAKPVQPVQPVQTRSTACEEDQGSTGSTGSTGLRHCSGKCEPPPSRVTVRPSTCPWTISWRIRHDAPGCDRPLCPP